MHEKVFQLPYDRCIEIDQEVDALLEEEKKKQQLNERKAKLMTDSRKSRHLAIYKWLGPNFILEYLSGCILFVILFILILFVGLALCAIVDSGNIKTDFDIRFLDIIKHIMPSPQNYIKKKMLKKNYLIPENVVDCPITTKQELYSLLDEKNKYYLTLKDGNLFLYNKDFDYELQVTGTVKNDETQYLINQLEEGKFYSITDIITDKQVKCEKGN